jgi:lysophospholipase L1-like esterase
VKGDEIVYNKVAAKVMNENGISVDDLWTAVQPHYPELQHRPNDVHYNDQGYRVLADSVVGSIKTSLAK